MLYENIFVLELLRTVMAFEEAINAMFGKLMIGPELPSGKRDEQIATIIESTDVGL